MLQTVFYQLTEHCGADPKLAERCWQEIQVHYREIHRHYHTIEHLEHLYLQLMDVREEIGDWEALLFSLFYHDVIFQPMAKDNEEQSASLAQLRLHELGFPEGRIKHCVGQIIATKKHRPSPDPDTNYFTDADLSILGSDWDDYVPYMHRIQEEYAEYPKEEYQAGRKKALLELCGMERLYKTDYFYEKFEKTARENMARELETL